MPSKRPQPPPDFVSQPVLCQGTLVEVAMASEIARLKHLNKRALVIITDAIMHGMPITEEVKDVRQQIAQL